MGKRIADSLKMRDRLVQNLGDIYSGMKFSGCTSAYTEQCRRTMLEANKIGNYPAWVRAYADGYWRALVDHAYRADLVYGGFVGDVFYSTHRDREDYYEKHGIEPREYADDGKVRQRGHYWKECLKPFYVG